MIVTYEEISSQLIGELPLCLGPSMILYFFGDLVDDLNSQGNFLGNF